MPTQLRPLHEEAKPREAMPKPPPARFAKRQPTLMFQSLGQMYRRHHGASKVAKERVIVWAVGIAAGATLFALIYAAIFFLEQS
ncbi:MAG: hypothetical protein U5J83_19145 [Bryobacterales bacterium]|nr:hypothetical protein [Bryobacterales bacterium]